MRRCVHLLFLALTLALPSQLVADAPMPGPCMRLLVALDFPVRELGRVGVPEALATACETALERLTTEPPRDAGPNVESDWLDERFIMQQALADANCDQACTPQNSALHAALVAAAGPSLVERFMTRARLNHTQHAMRDDESEGLARWLGHERRILRACTERANEVSFRALAEICARIDRTRVEREMAWVIEVGTVSARACMAL